MCTERKVSMSFIQKVEPYILSDDKFVRDFALHTINASHLGTENSFLLALKAMDKIGDNSPTNPIVPYTRNLPITEKVLEELLDRIAKKDNNTFWYFTMLQNCDTELMEKYSNQLKAFIHEAPIKRITSLLSMNSDQLIKEATDVMVSLETEGFSQTMYDYGKRIYKQLLQQEPITNEDIESVIKKEADKTFFGYIGIYYVYLAGERRVASLIPILSSLLTRTEEDLLQQEVIAALIKIGTKEVIREVAKPIQQGDAMFGAIDILENIKLEQAEETLLHYFVFTKNESIKPLLAEALCKQFSTKAIPKIEEFINNGYDNSLINLEEQLYANCAINNIDHPKLSEWKQKLIETERYWEKHRIEQAKQLATTHKIGRNDPCPCGSGKKYKKCCGA